MATGRMVKGMAKDCRSTLQVTNILDHSNKTSDTAPDDTITSREDITKVSGSRERSMEVVKPVNQMVTCTRALIVSGGAMEKAESFQKVSRSTESLQITKDTASVD